MSIISGMLIGLLVGVLGYKRKAILGNLIIGVVGALVGSQFVDLFGFTTVKENTWATLAMSNLGALLICCLCAILIRCARVLKQRIEE